MKFGPVPLAEAEGKILGHNIAGEDGRRVFKKGKPLTAADVEQLRRLGRSVVYVAELAPGDVDENTAALRLAQAVAGAGLRLSGPSTGRCNLLTTTLGVVRVDVARLSQLNACEGITLATLRSNTPARAGKMVATVKILPFAVPEAAILDAERIATGAIPIIHMTPLPERSVALILSGSPSAEERIRAAFVPPLEARLSALNATVHSVDFVPLEDESGEVDLARKLQQIGRGIGLILLAGETAVMDRHDMTPRAVERAGGEVTCFGAPVDPGNLLMLAYLEEVPVLGAPGCARSPKINIVDWVLPRLLAGDRLTRADILALGHGGLLEDVPERPLPRRRIMD